MSANVNTHAEQPDGVVHISGREFVSIFRYDGLLLAFTCPPAAVAGLDIESLDGRVMTLLADVAGAAGVGSGLEL